MIPARIWYLVENRDNLITKKLILKLFYIVYYALLRLQNQINFEVFYSNSQGKITLSC